MASLIAKKKGSKLYYYVVESARVDGQPRIVHQAYLGTAEQVADLVKDRTSPVHLSATMRDFGLPGSLWLAAHQTGVFSLLESLLPQPRSATSPAHYLLLAAIHRICQPGPKTEVADWYDRTVLHSLWNFPPECFTSQAFWDVFEKILPQESSGDDPLETAQLRLLALWKEKQGVSRRLLAYDQLLHLYCEHQHPQRTGPARCFGPDSAGGGPGCKWPSDAAFALIGNKNTIVTALAG